MNQNLKALGLSLMAVLALSAVVASAAQANNVTAAKYTATLTGKDLGKKAGEYARFTVGNGARFIECEESIYTATLVKAETVITVTPTYNKCFANGLTSVPATVTMNECDYMLEATSKTTARLSVKCPVGKQIEIHLYENAAAHTAKTSLCTYDISDKVVAEKKQNQNLEKITLEKGTEGGVEDITLKLALEKVAVNSTIGAAGVCGVKGPAETLATLNGTATITGNAGGATAIMIE